MTNRKLFLSLGAILFLSICPGGGDAWGQSAHSPYSLFGIGEISSGNYGENSGMGGIGIGFRQINSLNAANPAALSAITAQTFIFDGSAFGKYSTFRGQGRTENATAANLQRISIGFRVASRWSVSAGILPFSNVGYRFMKSTPIEGADGSVLTNFSGDGGLNQIYVAQALSLSKRLSVGVNASLVFGTVTHTEQSNYWTIVNTSRGQRVRFDFGMQYTMPVSSTTQMTLGVVGGPEVDIKMHNSSVAYDYQGLNPVERILLSTTQYVPEFFGAGVSLNRRNRLAVGLDYRFEKWSSTISSSGTVRFKDMHRVSLGASIIPRPFSAKNYLHVMKYQVGVSVNNSYLDIGGEAPINYAVTAGVVLPMRNSNLIHVALEYGKNGLTGGRNDIREDYLKLTIGFSFKESWFFRIKYD